MKSYLTSTFIILFVASAAFGQGNQNGFTLDEAVAYALKNSERIKQAQIDVEISEAKVRETTAIGLPQVNASADLNYYIDIPTQVAEASTFEPTAPPGVLVPLQFGLPYSTTAGVSASQLIFDGSYFVGLKASKGYLNATRLAMEKSEIEIKNDVAKIYFAVVSMNESLESLQENKLKVDQSASETKAMYEVGFLEKQDADQVKLSQSNLKYQIDVVTRQRDQMLNMLKVQMGLPVDQAIALTDEFEQLIEGIKNTTVDQSFSLDRHIDYRSLKQGEELSELSLSAQKTKYYPQLAAFFNHSQNGFSQEFGDLFSNDFYPTTIVGLQLKVPIFSSGMRFYQTKQAKLELEKTQSQKQQLSQSLTVQAQSATQNYSSALENLNMTQENLDLAETIKQSTEAKYKEGLASSLDYAQAESQYLQTLGAYINSAQELFNAKLALDKAIGNY